MKHPVVIIVEFLNIAIDHITNFWVIVIFWGFKCVLKILYQF